jgi:hypothetical protein
MRIGRSLCSWLIAIVLCHGRLLAQDSIPKFEVGPQFSYLHVQLGVVENQAGFGGKFGVNLHRSFAFDSELNFFQSVHRVPVLSTVAESRRASSASREVSARKGSVFLANFDQDSSPLAR